MTPIVSLTQALTRALTRTMEELDTASRLLGEVFAIGLWIRSDDSSDDRRKREGLREVDWAVSGAHRALASLTEAPVEVRTLQADLRALQTLAETLADQAAGTVGESLALDGMIMSMQDEVAKLRRRAEELLASPGFRA
jgi:hypothetical protein